MDELFELLIQAEDADFLEVRWNADPTYPTWIHVDFDTETFDDEATIEVVKFQVRGQGSRSSP